MKPRNIFTGLITISSIATCGRMLTEEAVPKELMHCAQTAVVDTFQRVSEPKIAVLDFFKGKHCNIDFDAKPDVSHGEVVSNIIRRGIPDAKVTDINIEFTNVSKDSALSKVDSILSTIVNNTKRGNKFDVINMSAGNMISFSELSQKTGLDITAENIAAKKRLIKQALRKKKDNSLHDTNSEITAAKVAGIIDKFDTISAYGTKIYIGAGNSGKKYVNIYNLVDNAVSVGGATTYGTKTSYSCDNSLVNRWSCARKEISRTKTGYNYTDGVTTDLKKEKATFNLHVSNIFCLDGTSFACPTAVVEDFGKNISNNVK